MATWYIFLCFQLHIPVLSTFPPLWTIFFYCTLSWSAVPIPAVFLPVLGRTEGLIHVSETLFLFLYLGVTLAIFTTVWHRWLMLGLSLTVTPTPIFAELLPNLLLHIQYLHCLLSVGYCSCIYWTLYFFPPILLVCKHNFMFYSHVPLVSSSFIPWL